MSIKKWNNQNLIRGDKRWWNTDLILLSWNNRLCKDREIYTSSCWPNGVIFGTSTEIITKKYELKPALISIVLLYLTHLQMLRRSRCNGGSIFKVVPECKKRYYEPLLSLCVTYNLISCQKLAKTLKFWKSLISLHSYVIWAPELRKDPK